MPSFLHLPLEIRDMIYREALYNDRYLIAKNEQLDHVKPESLREPSATIALLRASKQIHAEAAPIFFELNTFRPSFHPGLGKPSLFTSHAALFRNIRLTLSHPDDFRYFENHPVKTWKNQLQSLTLMVNLKLLELDVISFARFVESGRWNFETVYTQMSIIGKPPPAWSLMPELLAGVPLSVRKIEGVENQGIWTVGLFGGRDFYDGKFRNMHELGEACRHFGINVMVLKHEWSPPAFRWSAIFPRFSANRESSDAIQKYYYG